MAGTQNPTPKEIRDRTSLADIYSVDATPVVRVGPAWTACDNCEEWLDECTCT